MLGEPEVRSYLGRPLDLRIPVQGAGADALDAACFEILAQPQGGVSTLTRATLEVEQVGGQTYLRVRSSAPVLEPASLLRVRAACPPANGVLVRQYGILLDPVPASAPSVPLMAGATPQATPSVAVAAAAAVPVHATSVPARAPHKVSHKAASHAKRVHHRAAAAHAGFRLKLSGPMLDLEPSRNITGAQRALLREARTLIDGDDYASAMLALRDRIDTLQKRLEALQAEAARIEASARERPSVATAPAPREPAALRLVDGAWLWAMLALLGLVASLMPLTRWMRRRRSGEMPEPVAKPPPMEPGTETGRFAPPPPQVLAPGPAPAAAIAAGVALEDTEKAIRTARDLYNAGERLQAAGILRLAIESHPERVAPWLPLFDLLMRERLATEYGELARGFRALHGASAAWKTVQRAGREIDPANPLYADEGETRQVAA